MPVPIAPERVLPTLNADGTRNRIRPRLYDGRLLRARRWVAWALMLVFIGLPFVEVQGKPALLLDVLGRQFVFFGRTYLATDGALLMLLMLSIFVAIVLTTALVGRAWCGWACPQTVYMEFVFRPLERLFEGSRESQLRIDRAGGSTRRFVKNAVYLALSLLLANVFLAYFVGASTLFRWVVQSPSAHPGGFTVVLVTTGLVFFDFAYFREQMCTVICPYARLQSVLLDPKSLVVGYDAGRGEPRSKGKAPNPSYGDCIDCRACVVSCPTGIDIREGLQLECIACGQCADACDSIMERIHKPRGLIRYSSPFTLETQQPAPLLRPRVAIYALVLVGLVTTLLRMAGSPAQSEITILRGLGAPYSETGSEVVNQLRLKVQNRSGAAQQFRVEVAGLPAARVVAPELPLAVAANTQGAASFFVVVPRSELNGSRKVQLRVADGRSSQLVPYTLLGPRTEATP